MKLLILLSLLLSPQLALTYTDITGYIPHKTNKSPNYPLIARKQKLTGKTIIEFSVGKNSYVNHASIKQSSGHKILDDEALKAVKTWQFLKFETDKKVQKTFVFELSKPGHFKRNESKYNVIKYIFSHAPTREEYESKPK